MSLSESTTEIHPSQLALSVDIPHSSSAESSIAPSPNGILESGNNSPSCSSLHSHNLNVKFAPLPELAPRKRRSTTPLGMAARGQLVRRRRYGNYDDEPMQGNSPMWTDEEIADHRRQLKQQAKANARAQAAEDERGDEVDDALLALGRMVKGAGKTLWRKMSQKELGKERARGEEEELAKRGENEKPSTALVVVKENRAILAPLRRNTEELKIEEEGRVWEEEIDEQFPLHVGQTETIVEGRAMYSRSTSATPPTSTTAAKVEVVANKSLPPTTKTPSTKS